MLNMKSKIFKYIYAMLCLLPAIAVGVTCVYVANNDNAYQSYTNFNANDDKYVNVTSYDEMVSGQYYKCITNNNAIGQSGLTGKMFLTDLHVLAYGPNFASHISAIETSDYVSFWWTSSYNSLFARFSGVNNTNFQLSNAFIEFDFQFLGYEQVNQDNDFSYYFGDMIYYQQVINQTNTLDNVFYYSLDKVENSSVFSWVKSNFLYEGVNQFVGIFGGTNSNISFYLTWVLTISLCYLGFEVLMLFINMARNLIHSFTDKDRW